MSCNDVASILDNHRVSRLAPAERAAIDEHLAGCADCAAAWHAQSELLAMPMPPVPAALLERALLASRTPQHKPRRARLGLAIGGALLAGAALAAVTITTLTRSASDGTPPSGDATDAAASRTTTLEEPFAETASVRAPADDELTTAVERVQTGSDMLPLIRHAPQYPPDALAERAEGRVQVKFDITAAGVVENVTVVESSDVRFEMAAVEAVAKWRYLPRILAGKRVAVKDIHTVVRWVPPDADDPPADRETEAKQEAAVRGYLVFSGDLETALDELAADDLRGAELQLDQMLAVYPEGGFFHGDIWSFYGYLFTVQGNYDRAIDAYETGLASYARNRAPATMGPWVPLANLYFARHQYDMALKTLLRPTPGEGRLRGPDAAALAEKLRALGVTEETLQ